MLDHYDVVVSDGEWHSVHLVVTSDNMTLSVDNNPVSHLLTRQVRTGQYYFNKKSI